MAWQSIAQRGDSLAPETVVNIPSECRLYLRVLGNECVVFEVASSSTHLIQQPAGLILEGALSGPLSLLQLSERLLETVAIERRNEVFPYVVNSVQSFVSMGLLEIKETAG